VTGRSAILHARVPDPPGLFPAPGFLRDPARANGTEEVPVDLAELAAWAAGVTGSVQAARLDAEGGFTVEGE
jgi:hypothetical protein